MSTEVVSIQAEPRERTGSRYARRVREAGRLPAIVYGHKQTPEAVSLDAKETVRSIAEGHKLFKISISGAEDTVLLKDIQFDHLGSNVLHIDLERVNLDERVQTSIPIKFKGEAPGLGAAGAVFLHPTTELEIECTVGNLEDAIIVDISELGVNETIHASDVELPHQYQLLTDPDAVLAAVMIQQEEPEETDESAAAAGEMAEPEVISERRDEDENEDKKDDEG